jgi:hypothetical protein
VITCSISAPQGDESPLTGLPQFGSHLPGVIGSRDITLEDLTDVPYVFFSQRIHRFVDCIVRSDEMKGLWGLATGSWVLMTTI